jgi:hypothetical protein
VTVPVMEPVFNWENAIGAHRRGSIGSQERDVMVLTSLLNSPMPTAIRKTTQDHRGLLSFIVLRTTADVKPVCFSPVLKSP